MSTIQELFQQAQLAEAAYADFAAFPSSVTDALKSEGFSDAQATDFVTHWKVVDHISNTASGFSATVFQNKDTHQYVFAIRGTEDLFTPGGLVDFGAADLLDIGGQGIALHQALDLYNYLQSLRTPSGQPYQAAYLKTALAETVLLTPLWLASKLTGLDFYNASKAQLESAGFWVDGGTVSTIALGNSTDVVEDVDLKLGKAVPLGSAYDVVGHSLGGHLAMILGQLDIQNVASVETFNPPFFDPSTSDKLSEKFFLQLQEL